MAAPIWDSARPPEPHLIDDCVHCGFCLPTCPTYQLWDEEMDSPRGRIVLMRAGHEGYELNDQMVEHFDNCLGCMACVTACPSGVRYDQLIMDTRAQVERHHRRTPSKRALRKAIFALFPHPGRLRLTVPAAVVAKKLRLPIALLPDVTLRDAVRRLPQQHEARGPSRGRVAFLQGCVQRVYFSGVNDATVRVLAAEGFDVDAPAQPRCCGALMGHTGEDHGARALARETIERFERHDTVLVNAAGCGSAMKEYGHLLRDDPAWAERAAAFAARVQDVTEFLATAEPQQISQPAGSASSRPGIARSRSRGCARTPWAWARWQASW